MGKFPDCSVNYMFMYYQGWLLVAGDLVNGNLVEFIKSTISCRNVAIVIWESLFNKMTVLNVHVVGLRHVNWGNN